MKLRMAKGVKDVSPSDKIEKQKIVDSLRKMFETYGYSPLETPTIERASVLTLKYTGGDEIVKEIFRLTDQGGRKLALRYDLTIPLARYIGMNPQIKMPFRRYQIGRVFRDGPIKLGRYREFWQCDVDVVGCKDMDAEAELLTIAYKALKNMSLRFTIRINNRKVLNGILEHAGVPKKYQEGAILAIDKLEKKGMRAVEKELKGKGLKETSIEKIKNNIFVPGSNRQKLFRLRRILTSEEGKQGLKELKDLMDVLKKYKTIVNIDLSLARGLSYYTGTIFEIFLLDSKIKSAIAAGGRYDEMIGKLIGKSQEYPAVGISFGLDVIKDALEKEEKKRRPTESGIRRKRREKIQQTIR